MQQRLIRGSLLQQLLFELGFGDHALLNEEVGGGVAELTAAPGENQVILLLIQSLVVLRCKSL